jgi:hypothetical protein
MLTVNAAIPLTLKAEVDHVEVQLIFLGLFEMCLTLTMFG